MSQVRPRNFGRLVAAFFCLSLSARGRTAEHETRPLRAWGLSQVMAFQSWKLTKVTGCIVLREENTGRGHGVAWRIGS